MDIFVSYSSKDRPAAGRIAAALEGAGWTVWWDQVIPPGRVYDEVIEEEVAAARCIVVLWSPHSVASTWVRAEAGEALNRRILIPVLVEDVDIPLVFRQIHAANLIGWQGETDHHGYRQLLSAVDALLRDNEGEAGATPQAHAGPADALEGEGPLPGTIVAPASARKRPGLFSTAGPGRRRARLPLLALAIVLALAVVGAGGWRGWQEWRQAVRRETLQALPLPDMAGIWDTNFGKVDLAQDATEVRGTVTYFNGNRGTFRGTIGIHTSGDFFLLDYNWWNQSDHGDGEMRIYPGNSDSLRGMFVDQAGKTGEWIWKRAGPG